MIGSTALRCLASLLSHWQHSTACKERQVSAILSKLVVDKSHYFVYYTCV
jgi:hypothetical protein